MVNPNSLPVEGQLFEAGVGVLGLVFIIFIHGLGLRFINRGFSRTLAGFDDGTPRYRTDLLLARIVASLGILHLAETLLVSLPLWAWGIIPSLRDSYYFVLGCYTTIGSGDVNIPDEWRLFAPIIAMGGLFTFGWTGSVLVSIMSNLGQFDSAREARKRAATRR